MKILKVSGDNYAAMIFEDQFDSNDVMNQMIDNNLKN